MYIIRILPMASPKLGFPYRPLKKARFLEIPEVLFQQLQWY